MIANVWCWRFLMPSICAEQQYERKGIARKVVKARAVWQAILESQTETGTPYMLFKDSANRKSNQQNLGTIKCSNLCTEIIEYTSPDEVLALFACFCVVCDPEALHLCGMLYRSGCRMQSSIHRPSDVRAKGRHV